MLGLRCTESRPILCRTMSYHTLKLEGNYKRSATVTAIKNIFDFYLLYRIVCNMAQNFAFRFLFHNELLSHDSKKSLIPYWIQWDGSHSGSGYPDSRLEFQVDSGDSRDTMGYPWIPGGVQWSDGKDFLFT